MTQISQMEEYSPSYQSMQYRQNMLQALQGNQQNQNGPTRVTSGVPMNNGAAGLNPLQSQNNMLSNPNDMRRPSPHPPTLLGNQQPNSNGMTPNPTLQIQGRTINLADLTERAATLRNTIQNQEMQMRQLQAQRDGMPDNVFMAKMRTFQVDITNRKESLNKIITLTNICMQQNLNNGGGSLNNMGPSPGGPPPPGNNGQPWPAPFGSNAQPSSQPQAPGSGTPQQSMNPFPSLNPSPLNFPINNFANSASGPSNLGPNVPAPPLNPNVIGPLDKQRFETSYKQWCLTKNIVHNPRLLAFESRPIDLFQLHCHVMREGGIQNVTRKELWPVIAGRLGVVHFPGTANSPPNSGPAAAIHIQHVYKEYLSAFDTVYMACVLDSRRKTGQLPGGQFPQAALSFPEIVRGFNPNELCMIIACADKTAGWLRARGMSESMVDLIENHRASLQNMAVDQENFRNVLQGPQSSVKSEYIEPAMPSSTNDNAKAPPQENLAEYNNSMLEISNHLDDMQL